MNVALDSLTDTEAQAQMSERAYATPLFFVNTDSKEFSDSVSSLKSTLADLFASVDSRRFRNMLNSR